MIPVYSWVPGYFVGSEFQPKEGQLAVGTTFSASNQREVVVLFTGDIHGTVSSALEGNMFPRPGSRATGLDVLDSVGNITGFKTIRARGTITVTQTGLIRSGDRRIGMCLSEKGIYSV